MVSLTIPAKHLPEWMLAFSRHLRPENLVKIACTRYLELLRRHFRATVTPRHHTAHKLGAMPTGYWANPTTYTALNGNEIQVTKPGISRALGPVTIRPKRAKAITIPLSALAYGKRVADLRYSLGKPIFRPKGASILAYRSEDGKVEPLYALAGQVEQPKDASLLPSDETVHASIADAFDIHLSMISRQI